MVLGEATSLISFGIFIMRRIMELADTAQRNKEKCRLLKLRVGMISVLLEDLQNEWTPDDPTTRLLRDLNDALDDGRALVESCQERRTWSLVFRTQKKARKFDTLNQRITEILEMFHIANMSLILKTNRNSADVKKMVSLAVSIVEEAKKQRQNREEIQQLVQFVEQVAKLLQQLQSANLWWDDKTKPLLDGLKDLLQQARNILSHYKQPHKSNTRMPQAFCPGGGYYSQDEPHKILQIAHDIGYYVQFLDPPRHYHALDTYMNNNNRSNAGDKYRSRSGCLPQG